MIKIEANFESDLVNCARTWLEATWAPGPKIQQIADSDVLIRYFDTQRRLPSQRPRVVLLADDFTVPAGSENGCNLLLEKVCNGDNIRPHLSKDHLDFDNRDGLLNDWGIHHFHIGIGQDPKNPALSARSTSLLFAMVTEEVFCGIGIYEHKGWTDLRIVESLHRNWPQFVERFRISGIAPEPVTPEQRKQIRSCNGNSVVGVEDGTVYCFPEESVRLERRYRQLCMPAVRSRKCVSYKPC